MKWTLLFVLAASITSMAGAEPLLSPELEQLRADGFESLFNMDYEKALVHFEQMTKIEPKNPAGYIYSANTIWLHHLAMLRRLQTGIYNRNNSFFNKKEDSADPKVDKEFRSMIEKGILYSEAGLQANKNDLVAMYYLGIAKNVVAGYEATVKRSFFAALRNGSKGVDLHKKVLKKDPAFVDAKLSIGMYKYVVGSLPLAIKFLVLFGGVHGSKADGIRMLEDVAKNGNYARDDAAVLLVMLYNREKRIEDSVKTLKRLANQFHGNSLFRLELASNLGQLREFEESFKIFEGLLADKAAYEYMPDLIHYQYARVLAESSSWEKAFEQYEQAAASPKAPPAMVTDAHLEAGKCLDAIGKREEAKAQYQIVLKRPDVFDSQKTAKKYLKKPFVPQGSRS